MPLTRYLTGDSLEVCRTLPDDTFDAVISSPPFLALRNYSDLEGQIGSEANPAAFLDVLLELTEEWGRVLTPTGSLAIELGDTYSGSSMGGGDRSKESATGTAKQLRGSVLPSEPNRNGDGWPLAKSLTMIPTLYAASLAYGRNLLNPTHTFEPWRVRNVIVWARNNPPVGALGDKYRPATSYITVATRSAKRWFDLDAVRTDHKEASLARANSEAPRKMTARANGNPGNGESHAGAPLTNNPAGAPPLDVWHDTWTINSAGSSLSHFAMWPPKLAERLILSMCPAQVCVECGEPRRRITGPAEYVNRVNGRRTEAQEWQSGMLENRGAHSDKRGGSLIRQAETLGWSDCGHDDYRPGHVLDPFAGTGTTMCVAHCHGRDATGIDLDPANPALADARMREVKQNLFGYQDPTTEGQLDIFSTNP